MRGLGYGGPWYQPGMPTTIFPGGILGTLVLAAIVLWVVRK